MKDKILILVYVPAIEEVYDIYIPVVKKVGTIKKLIIQLVEENSEGNFIDDGCKSLYDKATGDKIEDEWFVKESKLKNGSKVILY